MTARELAEATKEFDREFTMDRSRPLARKQRLLWERAQADKPDVSIYVRKGGVDVVVHLDPELLAQANAFAVKNRTALPKMIDRGLRGLLAFGQ